MMTLPEAGDILERYFLCQYLQNMTQKYAFGDICERSARGATLVKPASIGP
jgi:hypothetical protein